MYMRRVALSLLLLFLAGCASAVAPPRYTVTTIDTRKEQLQLFLNDEQGQPFHDFTRLDGWLRNRGMQLVFAANAGMYHADFAPVGLLVIDGKELAPLNLDGGFGNFFMKPNGVFFVDASGPHVVESSEYPGLSDSVRIATQSGPLLLRRGKIHPAFQPNSRSRKLRNAVGIVGNKAVFVISEKPVTLYEFAAYLRDKLGCRDALYLDGSISSVYDAAKKRNTARAQLGPIIGTTTPVRATP